MATRVSFCVPQRRRSREGCRVRPHRPPDSPDLAIYSQAQRLALGELPDWDSPDIMTNWWSPWRLAQAVPVTVHNLSPTAHAVYATVHVAVSRFGIGTPRRPLGSRRVTVSAGGSVVVDFPLDQAALDGGPLIGVHVTLEHPHDRIAINNSGSQVIEGMRTSDDGRTHTLVIPVVNEASHPRTLTLEAHTQDVEVALSPSTLHLGPGEEGAVTLTTQVPDTLHAPAGGETRRHVIVVAREPEGEIVGGVTQIVRVDD